MNDKNDINGLPNSINGDGRTFVFQLKKLLSKFVGDSLENLREKIESGLSKLDNKVAVLENMPVTVEAPVPTQLILTWDEEGALWQWQCENAPYLDYFELRLDENPGAYDDKLLERTRDNKSRANPKVRSGTAYLYARTVFGKYGVAASHQFTKPVAAKPVPPVLSKTFEGVNITMAPLPIGAIGYKLVINDEEFEPATREFLWYQVSGQITVKYAIMDDIGISEWSDTVTAVVDYLIDGSNIKKNTIKGDRITANAILAAHISANAVEADKIKSGAVTTAKLDAKAVTADKIAANAVTADAIKAGSIIGEKISAGSIGTKHLASQDIDLTGSLQIVGGSVTLNENGLTVRDQNGGYTLYNETGTNYYGPNGNVFAIVGKMMIGEVSHGQRVKFAVPWVEPPHVLLAVRSLKTNATGYANIETQIVCEAVNVSRSGFTADIRTVLTSGTTVTPHEASLFGVIEKEALVSSINNQPSSAPREMTIIKEKTLAVLQTAKIIKLNFTVNFLLQEYIQHYGSNNSGGYLIYTPEQSGTVDILVNGNVAGSFQTERFAGSIREASSSSAQLNTIAKTKQFSVAVNKGTASQITVRYTARSHERIVYSTFHGRMFQINNNLILNTMELETSGALTIATGRATFICVDKGDANYTLE